MLYRGYYVELANSMSVLVLWSLFFVIVSAAADKSNVTRNLFLQTACEESYTPFHLELSTDGFPTETSWELRNAIDNSVINSTEFGDYEMKYTLYNETFCLNTDSCYQFIMSDDYGDGMESLISGYQLFYDNKFLLKGGGQFGKEQVSFNFGGCPSASPSTSMAPTQKPSTSPSETPLECIDSYLTFVLELKTDNFPEETWWNIVNTINNTIEYSRDKGYYKSKPSTESTEEYCLPATSCYQFIIFDSNGDGITPILNAGYSVNVDKVLIKTGGTFKFNETSMSFGDSCPTPSPSTSFAPSDSLAPSSNPSLAPSSQPTKSSIPSTTPTNSPHPTANPTNSIAPTSKPSWSPTISSVPTLSPTDERVDFTGTDRYNSRYFPVMIDYVPEGVFSFQPVTNCLDSLGRTGCVGIPRSYSDTPRWSGTLYPTPPKCNRRLKLCSLGIPMSQKSHNLLPVDKHEFEKVINFLPSKIDEGIGFLDDALINVIAVADFNNDNFLDMMLGYSGPPDKIFFNDGKGNFYDSYTFGSLLKKRTEAIATADFNNDGYEDVVFGFYGNYNRVAFNNRNGTFATYIRLPDSKNTRTRSIAVADVNDDGAVDIIVGNLDGDNQLYLNDGKGNFPIMNVLPGGVQKTTTIDVADVNGDGAIDIIIGNHFQNNQLLFNNQYGGFLFPVDLPGGALDTVSITVSDVDGDGIVDIIEATETNGGRVLFNDGNGMFLDIVVVATDKNKKINAISVADVNNDGMIDILMGMDEYKSVLLLNNGTGYFHTSIDLPTLTKTFAITAADYNHDGMVDLIVGTNNTFHGIVQFLPNQGVIPSFQSVIDVSDSKFRTTSIIAGDVNNDGAVDIIIGDFEEYNKLFLNDGTGRFRNAINLPGGKSHTSSLVTADINNDGFLDIIVGNFGQPNQLLLNDGQGGFNHHDLPGNLETIRLISADVNNDGLKDIIVGGENNQLLLQDENGMFSPIDLPGGSSNLSSLAAADVNDDGFIDILVSYYGDSFNQILLNDGQGIFNTSVNLPGASLNTLSIIAADFNDDGKLDIMTGNYEQRNQLLLNDGYGNFPNSTMLSDHYSLSTSIFAADVNGDGFIDCVIGNDRENNQIFLNNGYGSFKSPEELPGGQFATMSLAVADINNDGIMDIIIGNALEVNQIIPSTKSCPFGSAVLHSQSWCYACPSFMSYDPNLGTCRECMPDYFRETNGGSVNFQCFPCVNYMERKLGEDVCQFCPEGTFYNNTVVRDINNPSSWTSERCVQCGPGEYVSKDSNAIDACFKCVPGKYQPNNGSTDCLTCPKGKFQPEFGSSRCNDCPVGGYCNSVNSNDGGYSACPPGTYNDEPGQSSVLACKPCPAGTFNPSYGGYDASFCVPCPDGTFNNMTGQ